MSVGSLVIALLLVELPRITHRTIPMFDVFDSRIYLTINVEIPVMLGSHLTNAVMTTVYRVRVPSRLFVKDVR